MNIIHRLCHENHKFIWKHKKTLAMKIEAYQVCLWTMSMGNLGLCILHTLLRKSKVKTMLKYLSNSTPTWEATVCCTSRTVAESFASSEITLLLWFLSGTLTLIVAKPVSLKWSRSRRRCKACCCSSSRAAKQLSAEIPNDELQSSTSVCNVINVINIEHKNG